MSRKIRNHLRSNVVGYVAVFIALSGTAYAVDGPLPGVDQVGSEDIINGEIKAPELATNAIVDDTLNPITGSTKIGTGAIKESELGGSSVFSGEVAPGALNGSDIEDGSLHGADIEDGSLGAADLATGSVGTSEVASNTLTGDDVNESTLAGLDGQDAFDPSCDPSTGAYIDCASLRFTAGRSMQVLTTFTYGFRTDNGDPSGECATTLDGVQTSNTATTANTDSVIYQWGSIPVVDVISVGAGAHTLGLRCREILPDDHDIVFTDIRITATELAMD